LGLLVTGSRFGALAHLEVPNIVKDRCRLDLGPGVGKKRKGDASLDARTYTEIMAYVRERTSGPIFLSPTGERLDNPKALDYWREAFTFALVDEFWPDDAPRTLDELYVVTRVLVSNKMPTVGGNPLRLRADTIDARQREEQRVRALAERVRPAWHARMLGIDLHALRKTHRTWAEAAGVHPILIDKQIGHSTAAGSAAIDAARSLLVSPTGRKHYVDMGLDMIDAKRSAEAVRKILDDARIEVLASTKPSIFSPASTQPPAPILDLQAARAGG
ncbi:hypothetical protein HY251_03975, partial [bacterium]|nr:hypothetical protein [bacterium]